MTDGGPDLFLVCAVQGQLCAVPLNNVIEVLRPLPAEPVAGAPPFVLGMTIIRGVPVPLVDMGQLLSARRAQAKRFVNVRTGDRQVAFAVDAVLGVRAMAPDSVHPLPPLLADAAGDVVDTVGSLDAELLFVLSSTRILPNAVFEAVERDRSIS